jgi:VWFA-related protein
MRKSGIPNTPAIQCSHFIMRATLVTLVILCGVLGSRWMFSQDVPEDIHVDVGQVSVDFTVTNTEGKAVTDLNRYDFEILDNGVPTPVQNFSYVKTPYSVVTLLDCSESTRARLNLLVATIARFVDHLRPGDQVVIAAFGTEIRVVKDWGAGSGVQFTIPDSPMCHGTNFYDALDWAEKKLRGVTGRHGVIVYTDGRDSDVARKEVTVDGLKLRRVVPPEEDREFQKVLKTAKTSGAPFYFVAVDTDLNPGPDYGGPVPDLQQIRARMEQLVKDTGGRIVFPNVPGDAAPLFTQISQDLGIGYSVGFSRAKSNESIPRKIEIRVRGEDHVIHQNRDSYIASQIQ